MEDRLRPVAGGLLLGLFTLLFGIVWVVVLETQHEKIHDVLRSSVQSASSSHRDEMGAAWANGEKHKKGAPDNHDEGMEGHNMTGVEMGHEDPVMEEAHERLTRGHLHAMGLGLVAIAVSLVLAFLNSSRVIRTLASLATGVGAFIYPFSWIIMGFRTPSMGAEGAEESVMFIVGPAVILVLAGIVTTTICLLRGIARR
ncbi:MAG: hypothetical protein HY890_00450 [Deltaproteobacteria bacterium]|nr:hypothetical protein [Deltaproteobacteria bacterium]